MYIISSWKTGKNAAFEHESTPGSRIEFYILLLINHQDNENFCE